MQIIDRNVFDWYREFVIDQIEALGTEGKLPRDMNLGGISVDPPREASHGDLTTNAAMVLAREAKLKPRAIAELLVEKLKIDGPRRGIRSIEIAGPGFINLTLTDDFWQETLKYLLHAGPDYGRSELGKGIAVNVEYVSANPTGPLHLAHARGAVFGDALASLLEFAGYQVVREYYVNDAGQQVENLTYSVFARYYEAVLGIKADEEWFTARFGRAWEYRGDYLKPIGEALAQLHGERFLRADEREWLPVFRDFAVERLMAEVRADLAALGVHHQVFTSERALIAAGKVDAALADLDRRGLIYTGVLEPPKGKAPEDWEPREQTLFRATQFGDETDRPLKKSDGSWTYFAADIAYHWDKYRRLAALEPALTAMIDVWGADHGGYVKRMQAAVAAVTEGRGRLDVKVCQLVRLLREGQPVKMSKRAGTFVTLREVVEEVGAGVVRFIMLTRKNDAPLDFDLAKAVEQSRDNPVFYVQYAHARTHSVMRMAREADPKIDLTPAGLARAALDRLTDPAELGLIKLLAAWPRQVEAAAEAHEPHRLAFYLYDLAAAFHALWTKGKEEARLRFIIEGDATLTLARLALVRGLQQVIAAGLGIFGVEAVEEMH
jgi:arginyl-tRNA synthetase